MDGRRAAGQATNGKEKRESTKERKRGKEKKKEAAAGEKGAPIYTTAKGVRGLVFGVYTADMYTDMAGTSTIRTCIYMVADAGDHACARAHVRAVRE